MNPETFEESKKVAKQGGNVAKVALKELESKTGKNVVTDLNAKNFVNLEKLENKKKEKILAKKLVTNINSSKNKK